ncbi:MAG TPA: IctB family putative bicarbonate transporter [Oculatellaceae cyanobacterium]|jgi:putative inorganic carbon (HCO3(-)) transporter
MNLVWQRFTLSDLPLYQWRSSSYLYRLVGPLQAWRQSSWLMQWAEAIGAGLISLVFALAPFVANELVGVLLLASAGYWVLLTLSDNTRTAATPINLLVLLYWSIATVATAMSPVKNAAFTGWTKLTLYLLFFALMSRVVRSPRLRSWLITVYLHVALIVSVYGLRQWFFGAAQLATWVDPTSPLSKTTRVYSYLGNPNLLAAYLLPAIALSLAAMFAWRGWIPKALALTMFLVNTACMILTFSRGGWIGFVLIVFVFLVLQLFWWSVYLPSFWRKWSLPLLLGSLALLLTLTVAFVDPVRDRVGSMFAGRGDSSNNFRINVWTAVIEMIKDRPILGIGPGNTAFNKIYPLFQVSPRYSALSAYSIVLELAVETGFIGLGCFLWLLIVTFNEGVRQLGRLRKFANDEAFWLMGAIAAMVGLLGHGLFDTVWYRPEVNTLWWFMVALIASYYNPPRLVMGSHPDEQD